jgi:hypothetical protein
MALRWTAAGIMEATNGFGRLKAHRQLPTLKAAAGCSSDQVHNHTKA